MNRVGDNVSYYLTPRRYAGSEPTLYDMKGSRTEALLKDNFGAIREEILREYASQYESFTLAYGNDVKGFTGWKSRTLVLFRLNNRKNIADFPVLYAVLKKIPRLVLATISVLEPDSDIPGHYGDTDGVIRHHFAIKVPSGSEDLGMKVGWDRFSWKEGELVAFNAIHRHCVWNRTKEVRIVVIFDTVRNNIADTDAQVASRTFASLLTKYAAQKAPWLKNCPDPVVLTTHRLLSVGIRAAIGVKRGFDSVF